MTHTLYQSAASVKPWKDAPSSSFSASKLAEDISYVHASLLQWLHPNELLSSTRHKPVLNLLAETFNFICRLVVTDIVVADSVILAGSKISFWIKVAKKLNSLCDFNGLMSVVSALNNASIVRLKRVSLLLNSVKHFGHSCAVSLLLGVYAY